MTAHLTPVHASSGSLCHGCGEWSTRSLTVPPAVVLFDARSHCAAGTVLEWDRAHGIEAVS